MRWKGYGRLKVPGPAPPHREEADTRLSDPVVAALKPIDSERFQWQRAAAELHKVCHDSAYDGAKLKAVGGKAECVEDTRGLQARADNRAPQAPAQFTKAGASRKFLALLLIRERMSSEPKPNRCARWVKRCRLFSRTRTLH
jgi:hypothetical protein